MLPLSRKDILSTVFKKADCHCKKKKKQDCHLKFEEQQQGLLSSTNGCERELSAHRAMCHQQGAEDSCHSAEPQEPQYPSKPCPRCSL